MKIDYTYETIEMEPGPNLYIMGSTDDFVMLYEVIKPLAKVNGVSISLKETQRNIHFVNEHLQDVLLISVKEGRILNKIENQNAIMEIDSSYWKRIIKLVDSLGKAKGHHFIEFDNADLKEEFNIIMSSEW